MITSLYCFGAIRVEMVAETMSVGETACEEAGLRAGGQGWSWVEETELAKETRGAARGVRGQPEAGPPAAKGEQSVLKCSSERKIEYHPLDLATQRSTSDLGRRY